VGARSLVCSAWKVQANECREAARFVLLSPDSFEMLDAIFNGFDMSEHHRGCRLQTQAMGDIHHAEQSSLIAF